MKMRLVLLLGVVIWQATGSTSLPSNGRRGSAIVNAHPALTNLESASRSVNIFSDKLFKAIARSENGNLVCSPVSAAMVLLMTLFGAKGTTEQELRTAFALPSYGRLSSNGIQSLVGNLANFNRVELRLANKIFISQEFQVKSQFEDVTTNAFRSVAQRLDFAQSVQASNSINNWCQHQTNNRIKEIVSPSGLDSSTSIVLVNAVYFQGNWNSSFEERKTTLQPFRVGGTRIENVPTMIKVEDHIYGELPNIKARFIQLPYKSEGSLDAVSMFVILPDEINGVDEVKKNLDNVSLSHLFAAGELVSSTVHLPKFRIESKLDLKDPLRELGLTNMFTDEANFDGISDAGGLKISNVVQKAFIEVNEAGSEAAAVAQGEISFHVGLGESRHELFIVDRPFISIIATRDVTLFSAIISNPVYNQGSTSSADLDPTLNIRNRNRVPTRHSDLHEELIFSD